MCSRIMRVACWGDASLCSAQEPRGWSRPAKPAGRVRCPALRCWSRRLPASTCARGMMLLRPTMPRYHAGCSAGQGGELLLACARLMCASLSNHGMWLGATSPSRPSPCRSAEWPSARLADAGLSGAATAAVTCSRLLSANRASLRCRGGCHAACCAGHLALRPGPSAAVKLVEAWLCDSSLPSILIEISAQMAKYRPKSSNYQIL